ncbi:MAG: methionyl-tRNA formyltransferase [Candidatus Kerfeldbacteria bacterium]|nr:methionyl-tRNA formyltransferase [Candidatus Kerfeldbacteria bacterium]
MANADAHHLRIVFFGTPDFAVPCLRILSEHTTVVGCVTQPDKPQGRKQVLTPPPTKAFAEQQGILVWQPNTLRSNKPIGQEFQKKFAELAPDVAVVVAYGKIIPKELLSIPRYGFINVHGSLLPKFRGASPVQQAIADGMTETGVTIMLMDEGMDTGPMLSTHTVPIEQTDTAGTLYDKVYIVGAKLLYETIVGYINGSIHPIEQPHAQATYTKIITKEDGLIDWSTGAAAIERKIRALTPWPGTYTICNGKRVKILRAHLSETKHLVIDEVQPEGKKPMSFTAFSAGYPDCARTFLVV